MGSRRATEEEHELSVTWKEAVGTTKGTTKGTTREHHGADEMLAYFDHTLGAKANSKPIKYFSRSNLQFISFSKGIYEPLRVYSNYQPGLNKRATGDDRLLPNKDEEATPPPAHHTACAKHIAIAALA